MRRAAIKRITNLTEEVTDHYLSTLSIGALGASFSQLNMIHKATKPSQESSRTFGKVL